MLDCTSVSWQKRHHQPWDSHREGQGANGSQGATSTSLSWTHCRDISGTRDMVLHCPSTKTMVSSWVGVPPLQLKGQPITLEPHPKCPGEKCAQLIAPGYKGRNSKHIPAPLGGCSKPRVPLYTSEPEQDGCGNVFCMATNKGKC